MRNLMKTKIIGFTTFIFFLFTVITPFLFARSSPRLNKGKKWRIAYYEGGPYSDYTDTMRTFVMGLIELGWISDKNPPDYHETIPKPYLDWLINSNSLYLSFKPEDCYSANWDDQRRQKLRKALLTKLKQGDVDLVIAMGTWAGLDLANNEHGVPVLVLSTSDPINAGIIKSAENSGYNHVTARVDPTRYLRQLRMFHRIAAFNTLGIAYENTPDGKIYSALGEAEAVAKERGFKLILCEVADSNTDTQTSDQSCFECYRRLSQTVEAIYVTALACFDRNSVRIADLLRKSRVPSFSMVGSKFVKDGLMLSISSDSGYTELGRYNAMKLGEILNGTKPGELNQIFEDPLAITINMKTVRDVGFNMPKSILKIATEIYGE